jgi:hypothetical protein
LLPIALPPYLPVPVIVRRGAPNDSGARANDKA